MVKPQHSSQDPVIQGTCGHDETEQKHREKILNMCNASGQVAVPTVGEDGLRDAFHGRTGSVDKRKQVATSRHLTLNTSIGRGHWAASARDFSRAHFHSDAIFKG